jgi:hypothetical protein
MSFPPPIEALLGALLAIPAAVAIASGAKDGLTKGLCWALVVLGTLLALAGPVDPIGDVLTSNDIVTRVFGIALGVLGVAAAVRVPNRIIGTLLVTSGVMAAMRVTGLLGGWSFLNN